MRQPRISPQPGRTAPGATARQEAVMDRRRLVCARCAGLVSEGRCPTCRAARDEMHAAQRAMAAAVALALAAIAAVLLGFGDLARAGV